MTEHEDPTAHGAKADEVERQLDEMQERSDRLQGDIEGTGEDWERKKRDAKVPGAAGAPDEADDSGEDEPDDEADDAGDDEEDDR